MASAANMPSTSSARTPERQAEAPNESEQVIRRTLSGEDAQRPFMIPLEIDPYDTWERILLGTLDAECILTAWDTCPMFILRCENKYFQARLPQIVKLILDKYPEFLVDKREENRRGGVNVEFGRIIKSVSPSRQTLLNLRLVSKMCRNSVEEVLPTLDCRKICLRLDTTEKIQHIIKKIRDSEIMADTFFPPNLEVKETQEWQHQFHEAVGTLLQLIGRSTTTFCYESWKRPFYEKLKKWVGYMANLKNLELKTDLNARFRGVFNFEDLPTFPACPKLQSLTLSNPLRYTGFIVRRIFEANPQIISMRVQRVGLFFVIEAEDLLPDSEMHSMMPHLKRLRVPLFASLVRNLNVGVHLKELILYGHQSSENIVSKELFLFLNQFGDSLEHLELDLEVKRAEKSALNLPRLKFFMWRYTSSFRDGEWLQFLLAARNLEEVHVKILTFEVSDARFVLNSFCKTETGGLTIWETFPHLQKVLAEAPGRRVLLTRWRLP